jgi:SAM-dependent methyltransferase
MATIEELTGDLVTEQRPAILDLMASWDSHLPDRLKPSRVVGLGLNENELRENSALTERVVHDLNREPRLPFEDRSFEAVLCTVSVDYLTRPVEVFREVARVLKPGGLFLVSFSNRYFPTKVVATWREASEQRRVELVREYFRRSELFEEPRVFASKGKPRPAGDRYAELGIPSDPVFAVFADRVGGTGATRALGDALAGPSARLPEEIAARKREVGRSRRCPYCDRPLARWRVPQTPFTQWSSTHQFVCFNDDCSYYVQGWSTLAAQEVPGSYRFMYDPDSGGCHSMPVLTPNSLRESIVEADSEA